MKVKNGNLLNSTENIIVHQVNTRGVMGAGLANKLEKSIQKYKKNTK